MLELIVLHHAHPSHGTFHLLPVLDTAGLFNNWIQIFLFQANGGDLTNLLWISKIIYYSWNCGENFFGCEAFFEVFESCIYEYV